MIYRTLGKTGVMLSVIGMGGHEYLPNGKSRGFNENFELAIQPGYIFEGFGQDARKQVLQTAFENGINFFDVTHDSEKEALGRNLQEIKPPYPIYVQTRPEGMVYHYDPGNTKMARYDLLRAEVQRILKLLRRERLEFLNLAFMQEALDHDPDYLAKIRDNVANLKKEGLIQFACADTFSGEATYLRQIDTGCFDAIYINYNFADHAPQRKVLPLARERGLGVIAREAFMKGELFQMAAEAGIEDKSRLANAALKWLLTQEPVTNVILGTGKTAHLLSSLQILADLSLDDEEQELIEWIKTSATYRAYESAKLREFLRP